MMDTSIQSMGGENHLRKRRIGIMGGTFDPIHYGHLILGENAWEEFSLDKVLFMPSGKPPHKKNRKNRASDEERLEMVRLAVAGNPHFECSDFEMKRSGYTYTWKTLSLMKEENPDDDLFFIIGADSLFDFDGWSHPEQICGNCTLIAAIRNNLSEDAFDSRIDAVREKYHAEIEKLHTPNIDISSHMLRAKAAEGRSLKYYLPGSVEEYIKERKLYINTTE